MKIVAKSKNGNTQIYNYIYILFSICYLISLVALVIKNDALERICNYLFFGFGVIFFILMICDKIRALKKSHILLLLYFILIIMVWFYASGSFNLLILAINYFLMMTTFKLGEVVELNKTQKRINIFLLFIEGFFLVFLSLSKFAYAPYQEYTTVSKELTLGFSNPNQTSIIIYTYIVLLYFFTKSISNRKLKYLNFILIVYMIVLLILTKSRASMLACFLVLIIDMLYKNRKIESFTKKRWISYTMVLLPILFLGMYILFFEAGLMQEVVIFGKKLFSGREKIFTSTLSQISNVIVGNMETFHFSNSHNGALSIFANTGIIGIILYYIYIFMEINNYRKKVNKSNFIIYLLILSFYILGMAESAILISGNIYYFILLNSTVLFNQKKEEK